MCVCVCVCVGTDVEGHQPCEAKGGKRTRKVGRAVSIQRLQLSVLPGTDVLCE